MSESMEDLQQKERAAGLIGTIGDLRAAIKDAPDEQRVDLWYNDVGKVLQAVGVSGENTDFSFYVLDDYPPEFVKEEQAIIATELGDAVKPAA